MMLARLERPCFPRVNMEVLIESANGPRLVGNRRRPPRDNRNPYKHKDIFFSIKDILKAGMKRSREGMNVDERKRTQAVSLLQKSFGSSKEVSQPHLNKLCEEIESALYEIATTSSYSGAIRSLAANLQRNESLRARIIAGDIIPTELVAMTSKELSTPEQRSRDEKSEERLLRQKTLNEEGVSSQDLADEKCARCGSTSCEVLSKGLRDVGKSETWGAKDDEGRGRIISCLQCGHKWEDNGLGSLR